MVEQAERDYIKAMSENSAPSKGRLVVLSTKIDERIVEHIDALAAERQQSRAAWLAETAIARLTREGALLPTPRPDPFDLAKLMG